MCNEKTYTSTISSVTEYLAWVNSLQENAEAEYAKAKDEEKSECDYAFLYRGHSDIKYKLEPSAYREIEYVDENQNECTKSYRNVESKLYQETLRQNPQAFKDDTTTFERLVRMQHYGLPTRILDLTENHLVALFFACQENKKEDENGEKVECDGEVILFQTTKNLMRFPKDIPDISLVGIEYPFNLDKLKINVLKSFNIYIFKLKKFATGLAVKKSDTPLESFYINFMKNIEKSESIFYDNLTQTGQSGENRTIEFNEFTSQFILLKSNLDKYIDELIKGVQAEVDKTKNSESSKENWEKNYDYQRDLSTLDELDDDISDYVTSMYRNLEVTNSFNNDINSFLLSFTKHVFVYPSYNNERILRQKGAFLMFPIAKNLKLPELFYKKLHKLFIHKRTIDKSAKEIILKELNLLGINRSFLFPQLDQVVKDVMKKYPAEVVKQPK